MNFLGLGPGELILIMVLALIVFGPQKLPEIGSSLGRAIAEFRRASSQLTEELNREMRMDTPPQQPRQEEGPIVIDEPSPAPSLVAGETPSPSERVVQEPVRAESPALEESPDAVALMAVELPPEEALFAEEPSLAEILAGEGRSPGDAAAKVSLETEAAVADSLAQVAAPVAEDHREAEAAADTPTALAGRGSPLEKPDGQAA